MFNKYETRNVLHFRNDNQATQTDLEKLSIGSPDLHYSGTQILKTTQIFTKIIKWMTVTRKSSIYSSLFGIWF